jgi:hypothetical protein
MLAPLSIDHGEPGDALDHIVLSLRNYYDSGNFFLVTSPLSILVVLLDRLGRYEPAAVTSGFAVNTFTASSLSAIPVAVTHLREVLGDAGYETLARAGEHMTTAEMMRYAFEQIELAHAELPGR